ncbi:hypothetical protein Rsub_03807 [Raphidocelis subcapitata]|uniref:RRM domain-containing protein n=1 Tax=Raphidocelis subcapitata TaxID=307507 RepID=A0A2V0NW91_9CHLO|nr:hypothetical protein Rsub_03807 [Raphidocelis subcapitata]|eukprot:GBF90952.1 hypothetical protein Rsub_03807 [Raphidocelis subcapitata]
MMMQVAQPQQQQLYPQPQARGGFHGAAHISFESEDGSGGAGGPTTPPPLQGEPPSGHPTGMTPPPDAGPAAFSAPPPASPPQQQQHAAPVPAPLPPPPGSPAGVVALLQAQVAEGAARAAALELRLAALAPEAAALDALRRRAAELEALCALSAAELAAARERHDAAARAAAAHIKSQQVRILALERQLAGAAPQHPQAQQLAGQQQQPGQQHGEQQQHHHHQEHHQQQQQQQQQQHHRQQNGNGVAGPEPNGLLRAGSASPLPPLRIGGGGGSAGALGMLERGASVPEPLPQSTVSDFARDAQVWSLRQGPPALAHAAAAPRMQRAASLGLPSGNALDGGWGALPHAAAAAGFAAGGGGHQAGVPPPQQQHDSSGERFDLISDRSESQRLAGLLPFDLDTLGSDRGDPGAGAGSAPPLPPHAGGAGAGGRGGRRTPPPPPAAGVQLHALADQMGGARLRSWSDAWAAAPDAEPTRGADQSVGAALKRLGLQNAPPGPPAPPSAPPPRGGGEDASEPDAAAQNARLRSKRGAAPNCCLYVGFLGWWVGAEDLEAAFSPHGRLASVRLLVSKKSRRSREQAFVEFESVGAAAAAIAALDGADAATLVKQPGCGGLVVRFADQRKEDDAQ